MTKRYADGTDVPVVKTRAELEALLAKHGATSTAFFTNPRDAAVAFEIAGRRILFRLTLPDRQDKRFTQYKDAHGYWKPRSETAAAEKFEAGCRQKWRALLLAIKAKLVSVQEGIETLEEAFMAHVVMPDGQTVAEHVKPRIAAAYESGTMQPLLPPPRRDN
jgi:hypothetical protein